MKKQDQTALEILVETMEEATRLAVEGRYADLAEHAEALHAEVSSLGDLKERPNDEAPRLGAATETARLLQQKAFVLGRVLQHIRLVQTGLLEIGRAAQGGYERDGHFHAGKGPRVQIEG